MTHATDWCTAHGPRPCSCWDDGETDRLPPTVPPPVLDDVGGRPVVTPALRPGLL